LQELRVSLPIPAEKCIPAMADEAIARVRELEQWTRTLPQVAVETEHVLHAGMYARTIRIPAGVVLTGVLIRVPTMLVVSGHVTVFVGEGTVEIAGYHVIAASARRRQAFLAHKDTWLTMVFPTRAKTVEEAEEEFTEEVDLLMSRAEGAVNHVYITGEQPCQEQQQR
jgi:hypothetical protein